MDRSSICRDTDVRSHGARASTSKDCALRMKTPGLGVLVTLTLNLILGTVVHTQHVPERHTAMRNIDKRIPRHAEKTTLPGPAGVRWFSLCDKEPALIIKS